MDRAGGLCFNLTLESEDKGLPLDFDWSEIGQILAYLVPVAVFIIFNIFLRKQQEQKRRLEVVRGLIAEIGKNQKLMEAFSLQWQFKEFKTGHWQRHKDKLDYIDPALRATLAGAYEIAEDFNEEIALAKKQKSTSYLAGVRVDRLREPLAKSRQGLEEWYALNKDRKKPAEDESPS
jgi:hypothetical protein